MWSERNGDSVGGCHVSEGASVRLSKFLMAMHTEVRSLTASQWALRTTKNVSDTSRPCCCLIQWTAWDTPSSEQSKGDDRLMEGRAE